MEEERAVADDGDAALRPGDQPGAETGKPRGEDVLRLDGVAERVLLGAIVPPGIVEMIEGEGGKILRCSRTEGTRGWRPVSQMQDWRSQGADPCVPSVKPKDLW